MTKRIKPPFVSTTGSVGPRQPLTGPAPVKAPPKPVAPSAKPAAKSPAKSSPEAAAAPRSRTPEKPLAAPLATGEPGNALPETTAPPSTLDPAAFQPKVYAPGDIACPHQNVDLTNCGAQAGEPCTWQQPGMDGTYHAERIADAAAASQRDGIKPTKEQFDQAVWDSGLF